MNPTSTQSSPENSPETNPMLHAPMERSYVVRVAAKSLNATVETIINNQPKTVAQPVEVVTTVYNVEQTPNTSAQPVVPPTSDGGEWDRAQAVALAQARIKQISEITTSA